MHQSETKSSRSRAAVGGPLGEPAGRVFDLAYGRERVQDLMILLIIFCVFLLLRV